MVRLFSKRSSKPIKKKTREIEDVANIRYERKKRKLSIGNAIELIKKLRN